MKQLFLLGLLYLVLCTCAAVMLTPLVWLVAASFKGPDDLFHYVFFAPFLEPEEFIERTLTTGMSGYLWNLVLTLIPKIEFHNFRQLFGDVPFFRFFMNSCFVAGSTVIIQLFFSSLGGFALAKYEFIGKRFVIGLMLATMMIPSQVLMAPLYELIFKMGLVDTYMGLIIPGGVSVFGMFLFRQSMLDIPDDLLYAGRIDGCGEFRLYWDIVLPISRPMIGAFSLISFMGSWNSFLWPQIILHSQDRFTLPIGLNQMVGVYSQEYGTLMAGTLLSVLPVMLLFFLLQKEFISGLSAGAIKG
jgi:ABC-type glycerol-3-phosphate transport system permease component